MIFYGNKEKVVLFVVDIVLHLRPDLVSITIMTRGSSEDFSVRIVTGTLWDDIVLERASYYYLTRTDI